LHRGSLSPSTLALLTFGEFPGLFFAYLLVLLIL
jgi:hypothetical protein